MRRCHIRKQYTVPLMLGYQHRILGAMFIVILHFVVTNSKSVGRHCRCRMFRIRSPTFCMRFAWIYVCSVPKIN